MEAHWAGRAVESEVKEAPTGGLRALVHHLITSASCLAAVLSRCCRYQKLTAYLFARLCALMKFMRVASRQILLFACKCFPSAELLPTSPKARHPSPATRGVLVLVKRPQCDTACCKTNSRPHGSGPGQPGGRDGWCRISCVAKC